LYDYAVTHGLADRPTETVEDLAPEPVAVTGTDR
jgi:hypothetical protein